MILTFTRFVSFLLRMAHDKSLRQRKDGEYTGTESVETVLLRQVDQLAAQIIQVTREDEQTGASGERSAPQNGGRFRRTMQGRLRDQSKTLVQSGVNF